MGSKLLRCALVSATAVVAVGLFPGAAGAQIPPGKDALTTIPQTSQFQFPMEQGDFPGCPAGFFTIPLAGERLIEDGDTGVGNADTIVQRLEAIPPNPNNATIPIEIVELQLQSIHPITVQCNDGFQNWMVHVGLSENNPPGQMTVNQDQPGGGTFTAQLPILPRLVFTRVDGPGRVVIDIGKDGPPAVQDQFFFQIPPTPWAVGPCEFPFFVGPQVGRQWCPGQGPGGNIITGPTGRTLIPIHTESPIVIHDVFPAQPALEHFKCYEPKRLRGKAKRKAKFEKRTAQAVDQFGAASYRVTKRKELCNPAKKSSEPFLNKRAHQQCYSIKGGTPLNLQVSVANQFGNQDFIVRKPERLCLPTEKQELPGGALKPITTPIEHFTCYGLKEQTPLYSTGSGKPNKLKTKDQFGKDKVRVGSPRWLCAPTEKNQEGFFLPLEHELCYSIKGEDVRAKVKIKNQFERKRLRYKKPKLICVPTFKYRFPTVV